jgi:hypothetical protein
MLSAADERFLDRRRTLVRLWPVVGIGMAVVIVGFWGYLFVRRPLLANPLHLMHELERHAVSEATLVVLAAVGSLMVLATGLLLLVFVAFAFAAMANERRLIAILDAARGGERVRDSPGDRLDDSPGRE